MRGITSARVWSKYPPSASMHDVARLAVPMTSQITCTAVACPACMSYELGMSAASFVTTLVVEDDVIPRVSLLSLYNLQVETLETDW